MDDEQLKHLRSTLNQTVFKKEHFTEEHRNEVLNQIKKRSSRKKGSVFEKMRGWMKPALSTAFCLFLLVGIFYIVKLHIDQPATPGSHSANLYASNSSMKQATHHATKNSSALNQTEPNAAQSNKTAQNQLLPPVNMSGVTAVRLADPESGWTGGKGWIADTHDSGATWQITYRDQANQTVHQIFALNHQQVWATFETTPSQKTGLKLIKSVDGGKHWSTVGIVPNAGFLHFYSNVALSDNLESTDGGKTWVTLPLPKNVVGHAYFYNPKNGWAVTENQNQIFVKRTTDGGKTWKTVLTKPATVSLNDATIRSMGAQDAWVQLIGGSGMTQTSYSLFHTTDGGVNWLTVLANSTAGGGPAPGFPPQYNSGPHNTGSAPGALYVANQNVAFIGGVCSACDSPNTIGWTKDGGKSWHNGTVKLKGFGKQLLAIANKNNGWWIISPPNHPSVMYTTQDGGLHWTKVHTFH